MLLAVDIGNSRTKFGVFDGSSLISKWSVATSEIGSMPVDASDKGSPEFHAAIACSVVPAANESVSALIEEKYGLTARFVANNDDLGLTIYHTPLESLGTDRVVGAAAAAELHGVPCIVVSFGTATTIDVVNDVRELIGGLIAAGISTSARALAINTARLPEVEIVQPGGPVNVNTEAAIQAGLFYSQVGLIEKAIQVIQETVKGARVIATGGFAKLIAPATRCIDVVEEDLVLTGLELIWRRGAQQ